MNIKLIKKSKLNNWKNDECLSKIIHLFIDKVEIRFVGGCVRDALLGLELTDIDFAINCNPNEIIKIFLENKINYQDYGLKYGTVTALINNKKYEITSLRKDSETYGRFAKVEYTNSWEQDALRRDFTMNAIYVSINGEIYDFFNGIEHIKNKKILFIGNASKRIQEDYLRILRFYRFLGIFDNPMYVEEDLDLIEKNIDKIRSFISKNKINNEIIKMLKNPFAKNSFIIQSKIKHKKKNHLIKKLEQWWTEDIYESGLKNIKECVKIINEQP